MSYYQEGISSGSARPTLRRLGHLADEAGAARFGPIWGLVILGGRALQVGANEPVYGPLTMQQYIAMTHDRQTDGPPTPATAAQTQLDEPLDEPLRQETLRANFLKHDNL